MHEDINRKEKPKGQQQQKKRKNMMEMTIWSKKTAN